MGLILDSSVLIDAERGRTDLRRHLDAHAEEAVAIAAITASELLLGVHRPRTIRQRTARGRFVEWILVEIPVAEFGLEEARTHSRIWADLLVEGGTIGAHNLLIAATAITLGFRVATSNAGEFSRVPGLTVEDWKA